MSVKEVLTSLGATRTIWIDDFFNDGPEQLAAMLLEEVDVTETCGFPEIASVLRAFRTRPAATTERVIAVLAKAGDARQREMKDAFFKARNRLGKSGPELSSAAVDHICNLLQVDRDDRWHFDRAFAALEAVCDNDGRGDATVNYVVDLNDTMGSRTRGLDILMHLAALGSKGTAFILTHDAETAQEASKELDLRRQIEADAPETNRLSIPLCVIAKQRLFGNPSTADIEDALSVALKRAGLRRSVHEVLWKAEGTLANAFKDAAARLTEIAPEQLESHVVERGYREGVSELHVVERALTAHMARALREMFGVDETVRHGAKRMRSLRKVKLRPAEAEPAGNLASFYDAEVWETGTLINHGLSPVACGDVFELDADEPDIGKTKRRYILLGQPCDISLRPGQKRQQDTAFLICMKAKKDNKGLAKSKEPVLPFPVDGDWWEFQFRTATVAKLAILDLASFREDGKVRVDAGHAPPDGLLDGLASVYAARTAASENVLTAAVAQKAAAESEAAEAETKAPGSADGEVRSRAEAAASNVPALPAKAKLRADVAAMVHWPASLIHPDLQLTFSNDDDFKYIHCGLCAQPQRGTRDGRFKEAPLRVTWRVRRCGRIRMPFAAALLELYTAGVSRRAFDLDYMLVPPTRVGLSEPADAPPDGERGIAEVMEQEERMAADHLRQKGFSQDRIESWFGYVPASVEAVPESGVAGGPEAGTSAGPGAPEGT